MAASQAHERNGPKKGPWSPEEDRKLIACINKLNESGVRLRWEKVPELAGLNRNWKSCNGRWKQYLRPDMKRGELSQDEIETIITLQARLGNKWANIARQLGRSDSQIKNYWNGCLKKKIGKKDIPPQPLRYAAVFSANQNYPRRYAPRLHPDARLPSPHLHGVDFISTDPVDNYSFGNIPPATQSHSDAQLNLHSLPVVQQGFGDITPDPEAIGGLIPDPNVNYSESSECSMNNQVENLINPPAEEIPPWKAWLDEFLSGESTNETSDHFCPEIALV